MNIKIINKDIAQMSSDIIVNSANTELIPDGAVSEAIFDKAGYSKLKEACDYFIDGCPVGSAVITLAFNLKSKYIIHAVGPMEGHEYKSEELLKRCYIKALDLATDKNCHTICFPLISTGMSEFPIKLGWKIALTAVKEYLENVNSALDVTFCVISYQTQEIGIGILSQLYKDNAPILKYNIYDIRKNIGLLCKIKEIKEFGSANGSYQLAYPKELLNAVDMLDKDYNFDANIGKIKDARPSEMNYEQIKTMLSYIYYSQQHIEGFIRAYVENNTLLKLFLKLEELWIEENNKINYRNMTLDKLKKLHNDGRIFKYTFFSGHEKHECLTKDCFSQWYPSEFKYHGVKYNCCEQYMMSQKALLFKDYKTYDKIMKEKNPKKMKRLGREVRNFDRDKWYEIGPKIVLKGNYLKFTQNEDLKEYLLDTKNNIIAEASPYDTIWAIRMDENYEGVENPNNWGGFNKLGFALMEVREMIKNNECC